jgi:hypothetical protein
MTDPGTTPPKVCACGKHQDYRQPLPAEPAEEPDRYERLWREATDRLAAECARADDAERQRGKLAEALRELDRVTSAPIAPSLEDFVNQIRSIVKPALSPQEDE